MRLTALRIPTDAFGTVPSNVRPTAILHWPGRISATGTTSGTGNFAAVLTFNNTSMRLLSRATIRAAARSPDGRLTRIDVGCCAKLKALDTIKPSSETTSPVVGPSPTSTLPTFSNPPIVSIRTTHGAIRRTAARNDSSSNSVTSGCANAPPGNPRATTQNASHPARKIRDRRSIDTPRSLQKLARGDLPAFGTGHWLLVIGLMGLMVLVGRIGLMGLMGLIGRIGRMGHF